MRLKRLTEEGIDLGPDPAVSLLEMLWGVVAKHTSLLRPYYMSQQYWGGDMRSTERVP